MARILIVDDEEPIRHLIARVLIRAGYEISEAADGAEAATKLKAELFDLVITDIVMPNLDGLETLMNLAREGERVPVIAISGIYPDSSLYLKVAKSLGARMTLTKPFRETELLAAIENVLGSPRE
jgi:DNA-binding response OmpR family regulator